MLRLENSRKLHLTVDSYTREDLQVKTIESFVKFVTDPFAKDLKDATRCEPKPLEIKGRRAMQCEIFGAKDGYVFGYLITAVETDKEWHCITGMGIKSRFTLARDELGGIAMSFRTSDALGPSQVAP